MSIPKGATHFSDTYGIVDFFKFGDDYYSLDAGRVFRCWYYWDRDKWVKDKTVSSRLFKRISEFVPTG